jgi:invasion protein IalB
VDAFLEFFGNTVKTYNGRENFANTMKQFLPLAVVLSSFAAGAALAQPAAQSDAQPPAPPAAAAPKVDAKSYDDWVVRCPVTPQPGPCDAVQLLLEPKSKQRVLSVSVAYEATKAAYVVRIITPLGIWLPHGVAIVAGETKLDKVVVRRCEPFGCVVEGLLDPKLREAMRKGGEAKVVVYDQARKPLDLKFSLKGYGQAEDHMTTETKKAKPAVVPRPALP